jgi:hypothetical protein
MSRFLTDLRVQLMLSNFGIELKNPSGEPLWVLLSPFSYSSEIAEYVITVPEGFVSDFASVPRIPLVYDSLGNIAQRAAVIHDYLYATKALPRDIADKVLLEAMEVSGVSWLRRKMIYMGVRVGGASHYGNK